MKGFLKYCSVFALPFILMLGYYLVTDPFMAIWRYHDVDAIRSGHGCSNDALRGIHWMNANEDSLHYNSFIEGSSRSDFYYVDEWKKYLGDDAVCFHFNQSGDNLQGTLERVRYLYKRFDHIDNILFVMDREFLEDMSHHKGHLFRNPWQVTEEWDFFSFHWEFFRAFFTFDYQRKMLGFTQEKKELPRHYDSRWNEDYKDGAEMMLNSGQYEDYYSRFDKNYALYPRDSIEKVAEPVILQQQLDALQELKLLMAIGNTDYRIVISPLYNQEKLNPEDLFVLKSIFGKDKVFDFSGINEYTSDPYNYYEVSHYRPQLCNRILKVIYDTF